MSTNKKTSIASNDVRLMKEYFNCMNSADIPVKDDDESISATSSASVGYQPTFLEKSRRKEAPRQYPTAKPNHYSKDRRYIPATKKSDQKGICSKQGKGAKHKKLLASLG